MSERKFKYETIDGISDVNRLGTKPLMSEKEISCIASYLKPDYKMFEWGSGGSTLYFPKLVSGYCSVEHQLHWYRLVRRTLVKNKTKDKVVIRYIPPDKNFDFSDRDIQRSWFETYIESIGDFGIKKFDSILIDGENRTRGFCAKEALDYIDKKSVVFIHDYYNRPEIHYIEEYYDIIEKIEDGPSLVVLRKK